MIVDCGGRFKIEGDKIIKKDDIIYLFEWTNYFVIVEDVKGEVKIQIGDKIIGHKIKDVIPFEINNYIGRTKIKIFEGNKVIELRQVEVLSEKIPKMYGKDLSSLRIEEIINLHNTFCKEIIDEITNKVISLPFSICSPTGFEFVETEEPINELFAYHFLRSNRDRIISAYENILRYAHRKLVEELEWMDFWKATDVDEDTVLGIAYYPEYLVPSELAVVEINGKSYSPMKVLQRNKYETFATPENRFAKHFLAELIGWCERVLERLANKMDEKEEKGISELYAMLEYFWNDPIFSDVGELTMFPYTSHVLLKREGYRDLLELWREFKAYSPFFGELERAIANKDIAKLYEYWCFFRLVEELGKILGRYKLEIVVKPTGELSEGNVYAVFENGWKLYYNRKLKGYSVSLRPDFSIFDQNDLVGVFDAKFKLDIADADKFAEEDKEMKDKPNLQTWAKLEDIYKMHTYRDALKAKFAVVLYPGDMSMFFKVNRDGDNENDNGKVKDFKLNDLLDKDNVKLEGVGYLKFKPELEVIS